MGNPGGNIRLNVENAERGQGWGRDRAASVWRWGQKLQDMGGPRGGRTKEAQQRDETSLRERGDEDKAEADGKAENQENVVKEEGVSCRGMQASHTGRSRAGNP